MTENEQQQLYESIKKNAPKTFERLMQKLEQKKNMIADCIEIACQSSNDCYQDDINRLYLTCCSLMNQTEKYMLNYICLIKHKEHLNEGIQKEDADIQRWVKVMQRFRESDEVVIGILDKQFRQIINQYRIKNGVGRPKGRGAKDFVYNGKEYHTIQECADDYSISKQGMHKRLKKLNII